MAHFHSLTRPNGSLKSNDSAVNSTFVESAQSLEPVQSKGLQILEEFSKEQKGKPDFALKNKTKELVTLYQLH